MTWRRRRIRSKLQHFLTIIRGFGRNSILNLRSIHCKCRDFQTVFEDPILEPQLSNTARYGPIYCWIRKYNSQTIMLPIPFFRRIRLRIHLPFLARADPWLPHNSQTGAAAVWVHLRHNSPNRALISCRNPPFCLDPQITQLQTLSVICGRWSLNPLLNSPNFCSSQW